MAVVLLLGAAEPSTPFTVPNTDGCPYSTTLPVPTDSSENPSPGQMAPDPLPRPTDPVGGLRLGECGVVQPSGSAAVPGGISSAGWVVADLDSGDVLAAKDPHGLHRPASTLKVLTSLVALRDLPLDRVVVGTQADADVEGSKVGVGPGAKYPVKTLLTGLLLQSGNDAAHALAVAMGGDTATVAAMNSLAADVGALDTRAATPSGLDGPGQSISAYDLALLFRVAMQDTTFAALVGTERSTFPGYGGRPGFEIGNDTKLLYNYPGALGGKPGFTDDARQTFVGAAERDGRRLVVSLMAGEREPLVPSEQAAALLDWGFALPADTRSVGELVTAAPMPEPEPTTTAAVATPPPPAPSAVGAAPAATSDDDATRWPLIAVVTVGLAGATVLLASRQNKREP